GSTGVKIEAAYQNAIFKRARNLNSSVVLWGPNGPSTNDIEQHHLGDCYFLASCSAAAEFPSRVMNIFQVQYYDQEGIAVVNVYIRGRPWTVVIDDYLPWYNNNFWFAGPGPNGAIWVPFLEKAWAKAN